MNRMWILAAGGDREAGEIITSEDSEGAAIEATTQDDGGGGEPEAPGKQQQQSPYNMAIMIGLMFVVMYMFVFRGPRKKQQEQQKMVKSLGKNDRVRTIGGILGTVIDVRDDEITLKVDESNNTKIKVTPGAISSVLSDDRNL